MCGEGCLSEGAGKPYSEVRFVKVDNDGVEIFIRAGGEPVKDGTLPLCEDCDLYNPVSRRGDCPVHSAVVSLEMYHKVLLAVHGCPGFREKKREGQRELFG